MQISLLSALPPIIMDHLGWWIAGIIVVVGLFVLGIKDVARFSITRVWAISSVCFAESIRRKVLWITPLAIVGVVIVAQLQKPFDEQDAIQQTIKFCLFATGLVVTIATIILACTNLPREIENRVIFTIVTKPTTRLELALGKVVGFARVSGTILLIMGVFTWAYLHIRARGLQADIQSRLDAGAVETASIPTLKHYASPGALLTAKTFTQANRLDIYARLPETADMVKWTLGAAEQDVLVPFDLTLGDLIADGDTTLTPGLTGLIVELQTFVEQRQATAEELEQAPRDAADMMQDMPPGPPPGAPGGMPGMPTLPSLPGMPGGNTPAAPSTQPMMMSVLPVADVAPASQPATVPATAPAAKGLPNPRVAASIYTDQFDTIVSSRELNGGRSVDVPMDQPGAPIRIEVAPNLVERMVNLIRSRESDKPVRFYVQLQGRTPGVIYGFGSNSARLIVPGLLPDSMSVIEQAQGADGQPTAPFFRGRIGTHGQQVRGPAVNKEAAVAVYQFRDVELPAGDEPIPFEMRAGIERSGSEAAVDVEDPTLMTLQIRNVQTNQLSEVVNLSPESNRRVYLSVPAAAVAGGNFDVILRTLTPGHYVGLWTPPADKPSLVLVSDQQSFGFNLFKSLLIMWLLMILVIIISIFCSTFLSWPIAIMLTLMFLLGRWGLTQLGESSLSGMGNQVATDFGFRDAGPARVVSESVNILGRFVKILVVLPDISKFPAMENVSRGRTVPASEVMGALMVVLGYGIPTLVLSYIILKNKEVAP